MFKTAWGKLARNEEGDLTASLGLLEHSIDVAAVSAALISIPTHRARLERLAERALTQVDVARLVSLAFLHDLGKACSGFQSKSLQGDSRHILLNSASIHASSIECGHTKILGALLHDSKRLHALADCVPLAEIETWQGVDLWLAAVSHHGQPITLSGLECDMIPQRFQTWQPLAGYDPWETLGMMGQAVRSLFPEAFLDSVDPLPQAPPFVHAFAGLVSLADWIGSDSRDEAFPYDLADGLERWPAAQSRAKALLRTMCIDVEDIRVELARRAPDFGQVFCDPRGVAFKATELQSAMANPELGSLVIAEAETGSGKTEAALWRFKTLFEQGEVDSLAFLLPTRVSAVQIEKRVQQFIEALFPDPKLRPNVILAVPGYWRVDGVDAEKVLPQFEVLWPDLPKHIDVHRRWAAENTKRYLAAACAIGTVDQLLLSGLQSRHSHLRAFVALRSLLIVDEVHSSDAYMTRILRNVLERHSSAGGHALLLSATLGLATRDQFLERDDQSFHKDNPARAPFPCCTDQTSERPLQSSSQSKSIAIQTSACLDEPNRIADKAVAAVKAGARVLVIRNTVNAAVDTHSAIAERLGSKHPALFRAGPGIVCPHHGRFAAPDRRIIDRAVDEQFGKHSAPGARVLVGTQTLEQSLDIDADFMITDLAPMDVLLQRFGRLHRHSQRRRPAGFEQAQAVVLVPGQVGLLNYLGQGRVRGRHGMGPERAYSNLLSLDASWELLECRSVINVPEQNRELVELTTDPGLLYERAEAKGQKWAEAWSESFSEKLAKNSAAILVLCKWDQPWDSSNFSDDGRRAPTRIGDPALRLQLQRPWRSPFGAALEELSIPIWMAGEVEELATFEQIEMEGSLMIKTNARNYRYGSKGLSHE